jgi:ABC-type polysaccharide/polyol phosphate transport system ATPase subunit
MQRKPLRLVHPLESDPPLEDWSIAVDNVSKKFSIYLEDHARIFEFFGNRQHRSDHWALRDVSFTIPKNQSFGIIGPNGSGKSTLLKLIAGISLPTQGEIRIKGDISPLLDLGLGFHQSFTGRENIRMSCSLLGMNKEQAEKAVPDIISFAELGDFIDFPVRTYSAGMNLRLGFAIAAHTHAPILLVDEVLTVGDQYFQRKCIKKIEDFLDEGRTIVLVSHDLHSVRSLCNQVLWLENGRIQALGPAREVVQSYMEGKTKTGRGRIAGPFLGATQRPKVSPPKAVTTTKEDPVFQAKLIETVQLIDPKSHFEQLDTTPFDVTDGDRAIVQGSGEIRFLHVHILDGDAQPRTRFSTGEDLVVAVTFRTTEPVERPIFGVALFRSDNTYIHGPNTRFDQILERDFHGVYTFFIRWKSLPILAGQYRISIAVFDKNHLKPHIWHNQLYDIEITSPIDDHGLILLTHDWGMITHHEEE